MLTFFFILGIILFTVGAVVLFLSDGYNGTISLLLGVIIIGFSIMVKCSMNKEKTLKAETAMIDSSQITIPNDSIYAVQFKISWKDADGSVWAGSNIKLIGHTEKNIGDTITIKLK